MAIGFVALMVGAALSSIVSARWVALIIEVLIYFVPAMILIRFSGLRETRVFGIRGRIGGRLAILIIIVGAAYSISTSVLVEVAHSIKPIPEPFLNAILDLLVVESIPEFAAVVLVVAVVPAVAEELLFRGLVQPSLIGRFGPKFGIIATALLFAMFHLNPWTFLPLFIVGTLFGYLAYKTGTFWAGVVAHFGNNIPAIVEANRVGTIEYDALTEGVPWYILAIGLTAAVVGTVMLRRLIPARDSAPERE